MPTGGVKTEVRTYQMYINGEWVDSKSNKTFPVYDPASEEVIAQVPDANAEDVNRAVAAAKAAFEEGPWASTTAQERGRVLFRLADKIRQNLALLAELEARNSGKPIVEAARVPTYILAAAYQANSEDAERVANWHGVNRKDVLAAVKFEHQFAA